MKENTGVDNSYSSQYKQYQRLPLLLKRYSFDEKMRIAYTYSGGAIMYKQQIKENNVDVSPWNIETFAMLSMEAKEYDDKDFQGRNNKKAREMLSAIWDASSEILNQSYGRFNSIDIVLSSTLLMQLRSQQMEGIYKYRYAYVLGNNFDNLPLKDIFIEKMGATIEEYLLFGEILEVLFLVQPESKKVSISTNILQYVLFDRFPQITKHMLITRDDYVKLQHQYTKNQDEPYRYVYALCPSVQYPLVEYAGYVYLPLPHLLTQSVTTSLMYKLTENDDALRQKIGKHVWEKYVYDLLKESGAYQEVVREPKYKIKKSEALAPDVVARQGKEVLFVESKSTVPRVGIYVADINDYENNINTIGMYISKLAKRMWEFEQYNPFADEVSLDAKDHWGVIVVQEDSYIPRHLYYKKAREYLGLKEESKEWKWVVEHIKVTSLYEVEKICLQGYSVLKACQECFTNDPYTYPFANFIQHKFKSTNKTFIDFIEAHNRRVSDLAEVVKGLLKVGKTT